MAHWLASGDDAGTYCHVHRFDPTLWTVDFPRPMMAAAMTEGAHNLRVDAVFYRTDDLAGLIWEAEDRHDHPLLRYETARDFRECRLAFDWASDGLMPLDAVNGPTLTIEGRDAGGAARSWYVRLWNYAAGTPTRARVVLDFAEMDGGFLLPGEADPVWAGDVDRMFISLAPPGYTGAAGYLAGPVEASVTLRNVVCEGPGAVLRRGDGQVPAHKLRMATGYDDGYHLTPARVVRTIERLGYGSVINHYVGMSHYFGSSGAGTGCSSRRAGSTRRARPGIGGMRRPRGRRGTRSSGRCPTNCWTGIARTSGSSGARTGSRGRRGGTRRRRF